jgi:hypothetical protein
MSQALEAINQNIETGYQKLLMGEQGRYHGTRFVEDTYATAFTVDAAARTATAKTNFDTNSLSGEAYFFGSPTVREAIVVPEEIRMKVTTDYGRSKGLAWYSLLGWEIEWNATDASDARIIKWDSAA